MNKYKDTDLREALHRKYADEPQLPADFIAKMERRMAAGSTVPSGSAAGPDVKTDGAKRARLWRLVAAAACFLVVVGVGLHFQFKDTPKPIAKSDTSNQSIGHGQLSKSSGTFNEKSKTSEQKSTDFQANVLRLSSKSPRLSSKSPRTFEQKSKDFQAKVLAQSSKSPSSIDQPTTHDSDPNLHYASNDLTKDTIPYQDPARVDDYIYQLAEHHQVKPGQLTCSLPVDSSVVSSVYVFPDNDDINLFNRLLQVACWYNSKTPGYHLNFSQQQFFFELKDMRRQLQYRWIAERINSRILFYSTQAPIGVKESSACYQQYRDELMYQNSFNPRTKKL
jgi:hypothetical protein